MPEEAPPALDALPWLFLSADRLLAWLLVFPPIGGGEELSRDMLCQALAEGEISFGVDTQVVDRIAHGDRKYFHLYLVARGKPAFNKGRNTEISEDGTQLLAAIAGSVDFTGRCFQVNPVLEIAGDVDFSTGSLNFMGDINIRGSVLSGFSVRAMGNIRVAGVVEAGSTVEAGGDLVVVKGILGDGTTTVQVSRNLFSKYVENAVISVREDLQTDCIIGSSIYCGGEVVVQSGRGSIMGGRVWAARGVRANAVGSQSECKTSIVLGGRPCDSFGREVAHREVNDLEMELERLSCQPESPVRSSLLSKTKLKLMTAEMKLRQLEERAILEDSGRRDREEACGRLECAVAHPGTKIRIGGEVLRLQHTERRCVITMVQGEIVVM